MRFGRATAILLGAFSLACSASADYLCESDWGYSVVKLKVGWVGADFQSMGHEVRFVVKATAEKNQFGDTPIPSVHVPGTGKLFDCDRWDADLEVLICDGFGQQFRMGKAVHGDEPIRFSYTDVGMLYVADAGLSTSRVVTGECQRIE